MQLLINLLLAGHGVRDFATEQFAITLPQPMHRDPHCAFTYAEVLADLRVSGPVALAGSTVDGLGNSRARSDAPFGPGRPATRWHSDGWQGILRGVNTTPRSLVRPAVLLAINFLFLMVWGFAGIGKLIDGMPSWFDAKFGKTFFASFPGLTATFWLLAISEMLAFVLVLVALVRGEFLERKPAAFLPFALAWSLFVFLQLGFGQWLTGEFNGAFQQFMYFTGTLVALHVVQTATPAAPPAD